MKPKVLIGPAPLREIEPVYGPLLREAGLELVYPSRNAQMSEDELLELLPGCTAALAGSEPYTRRVIGHDPCWDQEFLGLHNVEQLPFEEVVRQSDYLSLHVPLMPGTRQMINSRTLALMKPTAFLINTARGGVVNEADLYDALKNRRIAGAGLDVYDVEPPGENPLLTLDNVVLTAHTAGVDLQSRDDMARVAAQAIVRMLCGDWPEGWVVNPEVRGKRQPV